MGFAPLIGGNDGKEIARFTFIEMIGFPNNRFKLVGCGIYALGVPRLGDKIFDTLLEFFQLSTEDFRGFFNAFAFERIHIGHLDQWTADGTSIGQ